MANQPHSAATVRDSLKSISEFKDLALDDATASYIAERQNRIDALEEKINEILIRHGVVDQPVSIKIGSELEFYNVAGPESFTKRTRQLAKANDASDGGERFEAALAKDDSFMPKKAQQPYLSSAFKTGFRQAQHVDVHSEPGYNAQIATERNFSKDGRTEEINRIAIFQHEIVSPPRDIKGLAPWLSAIAQRVIDKAPDYDLKRSQFTTTLHDMSSSSLHFHISMNGSKNGKEFNLLSRDAFPEDKGKRKADPKAPSQLALHTAQAINDFLKDYVYIFAPVEEAYERFRDQQFVGTSFIGFGPRKERFNMGSAIFRGEGREVFRAEDTAGKPDAGPLRIELRVPDVSSMGHPNKRAYPEQMMAPYDVTEAMMFMLYKGVENWAHDREAALQNKPIVAKTEDALYQQRYDLPVTVEKAAANLMNAQKSNEEFLTAERASIITDRGWRHQHLNDLDAKPNLPRGQNQDRRELLNKLLPPRGR